MDPIPPVGLPAGWVWTLAGDGTVVWGPPMPANPTSPIEIIISNPSGEIISAADGSIVPVTVQGGPTYIYIGNVRVDMAPGPGPVPADLPPPPNVGSLPDFTPPSYNDVYDTIYQWAINDGKTPAEAAQIASNAAGRLTDDEMWRALPNDTPEVVGGAIDSGLLDGIVAAGGALIFVASAVAQWCNYTSEQVNGAAIGQRQLVSFLYNLKDLLNTIRSCTSSLSSFVDGRSNPFVGWHDLGFLIYDFKGTLDMWADSLQADFLKWQSFNPANMFSGPNHTELTLTWQSQMQSCYDEWFGKIFGNETFTPTESATRRFQMLYDATSAAVNSYDPESANDFSQLPTP